MQLYEFVKPLLFRLDAEQAHHLVLRSWQAAMRLPGTSRLTASLRLSHPALQTSIAGISFANPLGLAAGFDKDGRAVEAFARLGFGFLELGTVTPRPQPGNPRPRLFRLVEDQALINRLGFNNQGAEALARRVQALRRRPLPLGINIGKQRETPPEAAAQDYLSCFRLLAPLASYIAVNVSSPNTPGLRALQRAEPLAELLSALLAAREELQQRSRPGPPIFVKLSPDEPGDVLDSTLEVLLRLGVDGIIVNNTTLERPASLRSSRRSETGGLSGRPLQERSTALVRSLYRATAGRVPLIGVGGIDGPQAAYARLCAGASLLQLYTALIYSGPGLIAHTLHGLLELLARDGFTHVEQAVGSDAYVGAQL